MARDGDRRGFDAPRRSPQELAETLATLAASTPDPRPRARRSRAEANVLQPDVALTPEPGVEAPGSDEGTVAAAVASDVPAPAADVPPPAFDVPAPVADDTPPALELSTPAAEDPAPPPDPPAPPPDPPDQNGLVVGTLPGESEAPPATGVTQPSEIKPRISNGRRAGTRVYSRAGGRVWQRGADSRSGGGPRSADWRRSRRPRSASDRTKPKSRNLRRLYPPLIVLLLIVIVVGLVNRGGGGSGKTSSQSASAPRSVFPTPSAVPTPTPPPVVVPTQTVTQPPTTTQQPIATQHKPCPPLQVNGRAVSVSILHGQVTCQSARAVVQAFESGKGRRGGSPGHQYLTVRGWKCVPSGICTRAGKSIKAS